MEVKKLKNILTPLEKRVQYQLSGRQTTGTDQAEPGAKRENKMASKYNITAKKWLHPTTGEVRVYLNGFAGDFGVTKAYAVADQDGDAKVIIEKASTQKMADSAKSSIRLHFGLYASFDAYLAACPAEAAKEDRSYGSKWANAYERHTGRAYGE